MVRPEWHGELEACEFARTAGEETRNLDEQNELSLGLVLPRARDASSPAPEATNVSFEELILVRQLREATKRGTANALREALESWLALSRVPADSSGHSTCGAWDVLTVREVVIRVLVEAMPLVYRRVLAAFAQRAFYGLYVPDVPVPEFMDQVPREMERGDDVWTFTPTWYGVAFGYGKGPDRRSERSPVARRGPRDHRPQMGERRSRTRTSGDGGAGSRRHPAPAEARRSREGGPSAPRVLKSRGWTSG